MHYHILLEDYSCFNYLVNYLAQNCIKIKGPGTVNSISNFVKDLIAFCQVLAQYHCDNSPILSKS